SILRRRLRPAQRKSTTIATIATPPFSFEIIDLFSIQPVKVPQKEGSPGPLTWKRVQILFETHPERLQVAEFLLKNGFSIKGNRMYVNEVEVPTLKVARAIGVDCWTVAETIRAMELDREVRTDFSKLESDGPSLRAAAKQLGLGVVEITADNPNKVGILANSSRGLAEHGISIGQALVDE